MPRANTAGSPTATMPTRRRQSVNAGRGAAVERLLIRRRHARCDALERVPQGFEHWTHLRRGSPAMPATARAGPARRHLNGTPDCRGFRPNPRQESLPTVFRGSRPTPVISLAGSIAKPVPGCRWRRSPAASQWGRATAPGYVGEDWIRTSSTRAREVGWRARTAAKLNGSRSRLSMRIGDLRSARTPHQGRRPRTSFCSTVGPRTAPRAPFHRSRDRARYRYYEEGSRSGPAVTASAFFENCSFSRDVMSQSSRTVLRQTA
jgi:hypothetical protein